MVADTPDAFAHECIKLLEDPERGTEIGEAARRLMEENYSWKAVGKELLSVYDTVLKLPPRPLTTGKAAK